MPTGFTFWFALLSSELPSNISTIGNTEKSSQALYPSSALLVFARLKGDFKGGEEERRREDRIGEDHALLPDFLIPNFFPFFSLYSPLLYQYYNGHH